MIRRDRTIREVMMSWRDLRLLISMTGANMQDGESSREELCPSCFGGSSAEKAFSIQRSGNTMFFKCFRASCGIKGSVDVHGTLGDQERSVVPKSIDMRRMFTGKLVPLEPAHNRLLGAKYGIWADELKELVSFDPEEGRFAFKVKSLGGVERGLNLRSFDPYKLKWDAYREAWDQPWLAWYDRPYVRKDSPLLIVEDQISALKASRQHPTVALLGTNLTLEMVQEIGLLSGNRRVMLALDKDATTKAIEYIEQFRFFTNGRFVALPLDKDIKFMSTPELMALVGAHNND